MINDYEATQPMTTDAHFGAGTQVSTNDTISILNGLIQTCKDGQDGFKDAAEGIQRSELKTVFYELSQQRAEFSGVLQELVRSLGGEPETEGTMTGALHRGWIDIKSAVTGQDEGSILNECERGEDSAKDAYAKALESVMPSNVRDVVSQQSQAILVAHNRIRALRNAENSRTAAPGSY